MSIKMIIMIYYKHLLISLVPFLITFYMLDYSNIIIFQLRNRMVDRKYDIYSQNLECSFCRKFFKCSDHLANIQRRSLKACDKCIDNFSFTIVHPHTYKIYKLLVIDMNITIAPSPEDSKYIEIQAQKQMQKEQLNRLQDEFSMEITHYYEKKIEDILKQMDKARDKLKQLFRQIQNDNCLSNQQKSDQLSKRLELFKQFGTSDVLRLVNGSTNSSSYKINLDLSTKASNDKENIPLNENKCSNRNIKNKICGFPQIKKIKSSNSKDSRVLFNSRSSRSISKSIVRDISTNKKMQQSIYTQLSSKYPENDWMEVAKQLNSELIFESYFAKEVKKQLNCVNKNESQRNIAELILEMKNKTSRNGQLVQLIGADASKVKFDCYLKSLGDIKDVKTIRIISSKLVDADMDILLNTLSQNSSVETLIVINNRLTELSLEALFRFKERHSDSRLSHVYLGNNRVNSFRADAILKKEKKSGLLIYC